jgi:hypothetical protein
VTAMLRMSGIAAVLLITGCSAAAPQPGDADVGSNADVASIASEGAMPAGAHIMPGRLLAEMLEQCSRDAPAAATDSWQPRASDIARLEAALPAALMGANSPPGGDFTAFPVGWVRQYVGIQRGETRTIYGNFVPLSNGEARPEAGTTVIGVCDGGPAFFGAEYEPATGRFTHIAFNGMA